MSLDVALLDRAISTSFLKSLCKELSESMVGSSGIQFFTRLYLGEQCHWTQNQSKLAILVPNVAKKIFKRCYKFSHSMNHYSCWKKLSYYLRELEITSQHFQFKTSAIAYSNNEGLNFQNHTECTG